LIAGGGKIDDRQTRVAESYHVRTFVNYLETACVWPAMIEAPHHAFQRRAQRFRVWHGFSLGQ
jgi:hypothetical protein